MLLLLGALAQVFSTWFPLVAPFTHSAKQWPDEMDPGEESVEVYGAAKLLRFSCATCPVPGSA